jgi:hypothetical protein
MNRRESLGTRRTRTTTPDGDRLPPVDHTQPIADAWEPVSFERDPEWELDSSIIEEEEHEVSESGGVEMAEVVLPVKRLLEETRLKRVGEEQHPMTVVHGVDGDAEYVASHDPELQTWRLVEMGLTEPWAAELHLEFERRRLDRDLSDCFHQPERNPPSEFG